MPLIQSKITSLIRFPAMAWQNGHVIILNLDALVAHVNGSSAQQSPCGSWKKYWKRHSGRNFPRVCQIHGCSSKAVVGAHVYVKHSHQNFILPTCQACNKDPDQEYGSGDWVSCKANPLLVRVKPHPNTHN